MATLGPEESLPSAPSYAPNSLCLCLTLCLSPSLLPSLSVQSPMESCRSAYRLADTWFTYWQHGDMAPNEMALIATRVGAGCACSAHLQGRVLQGKGGPSLGAAASAGEGGSANPLLVWEATHADRPACDAVDALSGSK